MKMKMVLWIISLSCIFSSAAAYAGLLQSGRYVTEAQACEYNVVDGGAFYYAEYASSDSYDCAEAGTLIQLEKAGNAMYAYQISEHSRIEWDAINSLTFVQYLSTYQEDGTWVRSSPKLFRLMQKI